MIMDSLLGARWVFEERFPGVGKQIWKRLIRNQDSWLWLKKMFKDDWQQWQAIFLEHNSGQEQAWRKPMIEREQTWQYPKNMTRLLLQVRLLLKRLKMSSNQDRKRKKAQSGWQTGRKDYNQHGDIMEG